MSQLRERGEACQNPYGFRYLADPLFLASALLYLSCRAAEAVEVIPPSGFFRSYFSDILLIPVALPPLLFLYRLLGLRHHDASPSSFEVWSNVALWTAICECLGPMGLARGTADPWDALAYAAGGLGAWVFWRTGGCIVSSSSRC